jgi:hypothetical protein
VGNRNPEHSDPEFAAAAGFPRPILHGVYTYRMTCKAMVDKLLDGDTSRVARYGDRFAGVVLPGETLKVNASAGLPSPAARVDGAAVRVAGELVAGELSALRCVAVSPGSNLFPELRTSRDVCGAPAGSASGFGISGVGAGAGDGVNCSSTRRSAQRLIRSNSLGPVAMCSCITSDSAPDRIR